MQGGCVGRPLSGNDQFVAGTEDMKAAYRQIPVAEAHQRFSIVAVWSSRDNKWLFAEEWGLAFGLSAAVLQFNGFAPAITAWARRWRWCALAATNFFDDFKIHDMARGLCAGPCFRELVSTV